MKTNSHISLKAVSQYLRCFIEKIDIPVSQSQKNNQVTNRNPTFKNLNAEALAIWEVGRPYEGYCLLFDTETTTDNR